MCCFRGDTLGGAGRTAEGRLSRRSEMKCFLTARNPLKLAEAAFERVICHAALEETLHNILREGPGLRTQLSEESTDAELMVGPVKLANKGDENKTAIQMWLAS